MWERLRTIANSENFPWVVAGNFNDVANANEKKEVLKPLIEDALFLETIWRSVSCMTWELVARNLLGGERSIMVDKEYMKDLIEL